MTNLRPKILIVDDIPENLFALEKVLSKLDVNVIKATSGNEALALTLDNDFALILLDVQMPGMNGFEVSELLKYEEKTSSIPIIFLTALDRDFEKEIKGYDSGAIDFIFKPFNEFILRSKVRNFLELYEMRHNLQLLVEEKTKELSKTKSYLVNIINSMPSYIIGINSSLEITLLNKPAEALFKTDIKNIIGKPLGDVCQLYKDNIIEIQKVIKDKKILNILRTQKYINGKLVYLNISVFPVFTESMSGAVIQADDITDIFKMEQTMIQNEKIISLGGLAAGMAHEINNPLAGIMQNTQVIKNRLHNKSDKSMAIAEKHNLSLDNMIAYMEERNILNMLDFVFESGERASKIVDNMLNFSRKSNQIKSMNNIIEIMENSIDLALKDKHLIASPKLKTLEIIRNFPDKISLINCEYTKIQQVFLNILKNDIEALGSDENTNPNPKIEIFIEEIDKVINIGIKDNGPGIEDDIKKRIFEPFFTTKDVGEGTGLGLSISYFIITEDHKGMMEVISNPGDGTEFKIQLPII